jgi:hypothetical protein
LHAVSKAQMNGDGAVGSSILWQGMRWDASGERQKKSDENGEDYDDPGGTPFPENKPSGFLGKRHRLYPVAEIRADVVPSRSARRYSALKFYSMAQWCAKRLQGLCLRGGGEAFVPVAVFTGVRRSIEKSAAASEIGIFPLEIHNCVDATTKFRMVATVVASQKRQEDASQWQEASSWN